MKKLSTFLLMIFLMPIISGAKTHTLELHDEHDGQAMVFDPGYLSVEPGDTINIVPKNAGHEPQVVFAPEGETLHKGKTDEELTFTVTQEGVYILDCANHGVMGMVGIIQVGNPTNIDKAKSFANILSEKILINKDRLQKLLSQVK